MTTSETSSEPAGYWVPGPDVFIPFEYVYYWHPESGSLFKTTSRDPDPLLLELDEHEFHLKHLQLLDPDAWNLI